MSSLKEYIKRVEEAAKAVIKAKRVLWDQFQQEIQHARGKMEKAKWALWDQFQQEIQHSKDKREKTKRAKVLLRLGDGDHKIVANSDCHLHNLIAKSQLEGVVED